MFETKDCIIGMANGNELGSIFGENKIYEIPNYQRDYNWGKQQLEELWTDITRAFKKKDEYYLGTIVGTPKIGQDNIFEIVDGQQRLTTLIILFFVLKKITQDEFLNNYIYYSNESRKLKFETGINSAQYFDDVFEEEQWYQYIEKIKNMETLKNKDKDREYKKTRAEARKENLNMYKKDEKIYIIGDAKEIKRRDNVKVNFYNTAFFFYYNILDKYDSKKIAEFQKYILEKIHFNRIICKTRADGLEMFQVVNDRGLDLSSADLIKTYLLREALKNGKERAFEVTYNNIKANVKEANMTMEEFFTIYVYYTKTANTIKGTQKEFKDIIDTTEYKELISNLLEISETIKSITQEKNWVKNCLRYLPWGQYIWSILLCGKDYESKINNIKENNDIDSINKDILSYYYLFWLSGANLNTIKTPSFTLMEKLKNGDGKIKNYLEENLIEKNVIECKYNKKYFVDIKKTFNENINKIGEEKYIKSLLMLIEYGKRDETDIPTNSFIDISKEDVQLEHILPQKYMSNPDGWGFWEKDTDVINTLGNLTLLKGSKNLAASNKALEHKIPEYERCESSYFKITREICEKYKSKKWDKEAVNRRTKEFKNILEEVLDIKFKKSTIE